MQLYCDMPEMRGVSPPLPSYAYTSSCLHTEARYMDINAIGTALLHVPALYNTQLSEYSD
jgi:hypothetical protein